MLLQEAHRNHRAEKYACVDIDNYDSKAHNPELSLLLEELIVKDRQQRIPLEEAKGKIGQMFDSFE